MLSECDLTYPHELCDLSVSMVKWHNRNDNSTHWQVECLFIKLFKKAESKLHITGLLWILTILVRH